MAYAMVILCMIEQNWCGAYNYENIRNLWTADLT